MNIETMAEDAFRFSTFGFGVCSLPSSGGGGYKTESKRAHKRLQRRRFRFERKNQEITRNEKRRRAARLARGASGIGFRVRATCSLFLFTF